MTRIPGYQEDMPDDVAMRLVRRHLAAHHPDRNNGEEGPLFQLCLEAMKYLREGRKREAGRPEGVAALTVSLQDVLSLRCVPMDASSFRACSRCGGSGIDPVRDDCPHCEGEGRVMKTSHGRSMLVSCRHCRGTGEVTIPCAVCHGRHTAPGQDTVTLKAGTRDGDIISSSSGRAVRIGVQMPPGVTVEDDDLFITLRTPYATFVRGGSVVFTAPDGEQGMLVLEKGTPDGLIRRLKRRGLPLYGGRGRGDLVVQLLVRIPGAEASESLEPLHFMKHALDIAHIGKSKTRKLAG